MPDDDADEIARLRALNAQLLQALKHVHQCGDCATEAWLSCPGGRHALQVIKEAEEEK